MHSPHPETKPLQSPAGNSPSQRHLRGTSLQGCRAEGMIHLYSAIKALILSFLFPSRGSRQSALLLPISHPHCSALWRLGAPSPLCGAAATESPLSPAAPAGLGDPPPCLPPFRPMMRFLLSQPLLGGTVRHRTLLLGNPCVQPCSEA